jgi:WD40 repeat protein
MAEQVQVVSVVFSPTEQIVAALESAGGHDASLKLWNIDTGEQVTEVNRGNLTKDSIGGVNSLAFSPDGKFLAFTISAGTVVLWNLEANAVEKSFDTGGLSQISVAFSRGGDVLATAGGAAYTTRYSSHNFSQAKVWNVATGQRIGIFTTVQDDRVQAIAFSPDGTKLAIAGSNATRIWSVGSGRISQVFRGHQPESIAFSPDGQMLASGGSFPYLLFWRVKP